MADNERNLNESELNKEYPVFDSEIGSFKDRLKVLVEKWPSIRSFAKHADVSETALRNYMKGRLPQIDVADRLARTGDVSYQYLVYGVKPELSVKEASAIYQSNMQEFALISEYQVVSREESDELNGDDTLNRRVAISKAYLSTRKLNEEDLAVVLASGDSMEPTIHNGNDILVDISDKQLKDGSIYVLKFGEELYAKRLQKRFDGSIELLSDNKEYKDQIVKVDELEQLVIIGKVVWIGKDL